VGNTSDRQLIVYVAIGALVVCVFIGDLVTPLGFAIWVLYMAAVGLCLLQRNPVLPLLVASLTSVLVIAGYFVSPVGLSGLHVIFNRGIGLFTVWLTAVIVRQALLTRAEASRLSWLSEGQAAVAKSTLGDLKPDEVADAMLSALARYTSAQVGLLYRVEGASLLRTAGHALPDTIDPAPALKIGDSVVGQVARDMKPVLLRDAPGHMKVATALGASQPQALVVAPLTVDGAANGVIELGFLGTMNEPALMLQLMERLAGDMGIALRTAVYRQRVGELLEETQRQSEELQVQQQELRVANEELEEQSKALRDSQARLENQQSELEQTNAQLEAQANDLERQKEDLLRAQAALKASATKLERASRYKSEFLANISHELRTPLNSSLILSKLLADNAAGNLTEEQVGYAKVIQTSNNDLLALINDILDLSKIEAGHFEVQPEAVRVAEILESLRSGFEVAAAQRNLEYRIEESPHVPEVLTTDVRRLHQILRNLLSNAFKFTHAGSVTLRVSPAPDGRVAFSVEDTGIGVPEEERSAIFEAFHQADGTTSRKYGGTGLGLSISRELAKMLSGAIDVQSTVGVGSVFTLTIPAVLDVPEASGASPKPDNAAPVRSHPTTPAAPAAQPAVRMPSAPTHIADDREHRERERLILIVEDDPKFAQILYGLAHELDLDCVHTTLGSEAPALARELKPSGILLDVGLPDGSGLSVLERLKRDPVTRHIPVHMMSVDDHTQPALELGAIGYTLKPAARDQLTSAIENLKGRLDSGTRRVLIVEDDVTLRESIAVLLRADDVEITLAGTVQEALEHMDARQFDCMVMDLALPDASGFDLLERISDGEKKYTSPPVIVYTGRALTAQDEQRLRRYSRSIIIKGARSPERLLDEVTLFLHRVEATLPPAQQKLLRQARQRDAAFDGRVILLAEDDVRNIYALSSVIEPLGAKLEIARNGREALERLADGSQIDLVLMDVMMPEMDGLTAMREIRKSPKTARLPIIAITAKAMPEDRQTCLDAGANDYVAKPIDVDRLLSLCRVWMPK
jgi:CheY-like chemotaxis protein